MAGTSGTGGQEETEGTSRVAIVGQPAGGQPDPEWADSLRWASGRLAAVLRDRGVDVIEQPPAADDAHNHDGHDHAATVDLRIRVADGAEAAGRPGDAPDDLGPEGFALTPSDGELVVSAGGRTGMVYAVLELADRAAHADDPIARLRSTEPTVARPATRVRGISRYFVSEPQDLPWFRDKSFWDDYLTALATHRFNRINLSLGIGYDHGHDPGVHDNYLCFAYPFLLSVPGYDVTVENLPPEEAAQNLEALQYASEAARLRGLDFVLGLWTQAYQFRDSPEENYPVRGLDDKTHPAYCRDALAHLLRECPAISGVNLRVHYESGVPEPSEQFWEQVFPGIAAAGRPVEIDMHPKGATAEMIDAALGTGMPVTVSPKFWAEHLGLPYHQAGIRSTEQVRRDRRPTFDLGAVTAGVRRFTRYGYGDYLREDRKYSIVHRIWPGTQRLLLWGDPVFAAAYGRAASFGGSDGMELCEPLSFAGRKGSGRPGGREPYADPALQAGDGGWDKYAYTYRLWGRLLYDPAAEPDQWRRELRAEFGDGAYAVEQALGHASRILPLVTTAHHPSAANNHYWPEMYSDLRISPASGVPQPYGDTPEPKVFGSVEALDPVLFRRIDDHADDLLAGRADPRYSPAEVAGWLDGLADAAEQHLAAATTLVPDPAAPAFRRLAVDTSIQLWVGRFFARKYAAALEYALFARTHEVARLGQALAEQRAARRAWCALVDAAGSAYRDDLTFGLVPHLRGHWRDRLARIDDNIAALEREYEAAGGRSGDGGPATGAGSAVAVADAGPGRRELLGRPEAAHTPPAGYRRGRPVELVVTAPDTEALGLTVRMRYRHAHQGEEYEVQELRADGSRHTGVIPAAYTGSPYPLVYFFELVHAGGAWLYPGLGRSLADQPYHLLRPE